MKKGKPDDKYMVKNEKYDKKLLKKEVKSMKTAGIATALKKAEKEEGKAKIPKVKPQRKY